MLYERLHLTTGSIVVPGYIAVFLVYPMVVVATFVNALLSYVYHEPLLAQALHALRPHQVHADGVDLDLDPDDRCSSSAHRGRGCGRATSRCSSAPATSCRRLIAHDMGRQGIKRTTKAVLLAGVIVSLADRPRAGAAAEGRQRPRPAGRLRHDVDRQPLDPAWPCCCRRPRRGVSPSNYNLSPAASSARRTSACSWAIRIRSLVAFTIALRHVPARALRVDERADPLRSPEVLGDAADIVDDLVDPAVGRTIVLQCPRHQPSRPGVDGLDAAVRAGPAGQRHGPHQPASGGGRAVGLAAAFVVPTTWWIQSIVEGGTLALPWIDVVAVDLRDHLLEVGPPAVPPLPPGSEEVDDDIDEDPTISTSDYVEIVVAEFERRASPGCRAPPVADLRRGVRAGVRGRRRRCGGSRGATPTRRGTAHLAVRRATQGRPAVEQPAGGNGAAPRMPDDLSDIDWSAFVPNVYSIDSTGWSATGNKRWQRRSPRRLGRRRPLARRSASPPTTATPASPESRRGWSRHATTAGDGAACDNAPGLSAREIASRARLPGIRSRARLTLLVSPRRRRRRRRRWSRCRGCCSARLPDPRRRRWRSRPSAGTPAPSRRTRGSASFPSRLGSACR